MRTLDLPGGRVYFVAVLVLAAALVMVALAASAQAFTYTVTGTINWTDPAGNLHPARNVTVDLLNSSGTTVDATGTTDLNGLYSVAFTNPTFLNFTENLRIRSSNPGGAVSPDGVTAYYGFSPASFSVGAGTNYIGVDMQNTPTDYFASPAFSVADALLTGYQYASAVRPAPPAQLAAVFPETAESASYYSPAANNIHITAQRTWDWDVVLHEYGHYLQNVDGLQNSPGGSHTFGVSNIAGYNAPDPLDSIPARGKSGGIRLAWGEGSATYMGIAAQFINPVANNLPTTLANVGDTRYTTTGANAFSIDLATPTGTIARGEGDELAVARVLWWIADPQNGTTDRVSRGHMQVYSDLLAARVGGTLQTLSQVNNYYMNTIAANDKQRTDYGAILQANSISPVPSPPSSLPIWYYSAPPTFTWQRGNDDANDTFHLIVWDDAGLTHRVINDILIPGDVMSYTLTAAQWALINATQGTKWFAITGGDFVSNLLDDPTVPDGTAYAGLAGTGPYWSDVNSFTVVPEPSTLLLLLLGLPALLLRRRRNA